MAEKDPLAEYVSRKWDDLSDDLFEDVKEFADKHGYDTARVATLLGRELGAVDDQYYDWVEDQ